MRINVAIPENEVSKPILDATLEAVTRLDESLLSGGNVPLFRDVAHVVRWAPEPPGQEHFDHAGIVMKRGKGDCDDLAPWHAASLRHTGEDPHARAVVTRSGARRWHAVVQRGDGSIDDPSKEAGMRPGVPHFGVSGAALPSIGGGTNIGSFLDDLPRLAIRPVLNPVSDTIEAWQARADLPWHWSPGTSPVDVAMASLHKSPVASQAIVGALTGAINLGETSGFVSGATVDCAHAIAWACDGADWQEIADEFGPDAADYATATVAGLFKKFGKTLKKISSGAVKAVTSKAGRALISIIPGVGPAVATALDIASPALNKLSSSKPTKKTGLTASPVNPFGFMKDAKKAALASKASEVQKHGIILPNREIITIRYIPEGAR